MRRVLIACVLASACRTEMPLAPQDAGPDVSLAFSIVDADPSLAPAVASSSTRADADRLASYAAAVPITSKSIGHTSVVFRVDFESDAEKLRAAYKPESKRGHKRYRAEVAAYRLAKALGIGNVPPATIRVFRREALRASAMNDTELDAPGVPHALALFDAEVMDRSGRVYGALMPWIPKLEFIPLESPAEKARWKTELTSAGDLTEDRRRLASQISTLVVFDALTGNWDRWSGANVGIDKATGTLLYVDNDAAFFDPIPPLFAAQLTLLRGVDRFSRVLVSRLRALDALSMADAIGEEEPGVPLLSAHGIAAADQRRKDILAIIDAKIAALTEPAVLFFP